MCINMYNYIVYYDNNVYILYICRAYILHFVYAAYTKWSASETYKLFLLIRETNVTNKLRN